MTEQNTTGVSIMNWLKGKLIFVLLILFAISVAGNVWFMMGKGINIDKSSTSISTSNSYANSSSSSIAVNVNGGNYWGSNKVTYNVMTFADLKDLTIFTNSLSEGNLYNMQVIVNPNNTYSLMYRDTTDMKQTDSKTVKVVNGVEQK